MGRAIGPDGRMDSRRSVAWLALQTALKARIMSLVEDQIIALVPAFNERRAIVPVVALTAAQMPVVVVDDGSTDGTGQAAAEAGAHILRHPTNHGKGAALRTGFQWALDNDVRAVITLDADGQHNPTDIPAFVQAHEQTGAHLVIGRRDHRRMPFPRTFTNPFGSWLLSLAVGEPIYDNQSGFRLYHRKLLEAIDQATVGFEFEVEVIGTALRNDFIFAWVDIETIYGTETTSYFHPLLDSLRFLRTVWRARRWRRPTRSGANA